MTADKEEGKRYIRRITSIVILLTIIIVLSVVSVSAQQTGCCEITKPAAGEAKLYCQNNYIQDNCETTIKSLIPCPDVKNVDNIYTCKKGVMVCPSGCSANKTYSEAMDTRGCYWEDATSTEDVDKCKEGCCSIPSEIVCEVKSKIVCENQAFDINCAEGKCDFDLSVKTDSACSNLCDLKEKGTCKMAAGDCVWTTKEGCINKLVEKSLTLTTGLNFFPNTYVSEVVSCGTTPNYYLGCKEYGKQDEICWFDNEGNVEECIYDCEDSNAVCEKCSSDSCNNISIGFTQPAAYHEGIIEKNDPYCKQSTCDVELKYGGQEWNEEQKRFVVAYPTKKASILNYRSICYNFFTGHPGYYDSDWSDDDEMKTQMNELFAISTGLQNSKIVCERGEAKYHGFGDNRNKIGVQTGTTCLGRDNKYEDCLKCGDTEGSLLGIDRDMLGDVVSIDRVGTGIAEGIFATSLCDKDECEAKGDCVFLIDLSTKNDVGVCVPKFPPGTTDLCGQCGEGGDAMFNFCNRDEAYQLGNCKFVQADDWKKWATVLVHIPTTYYSERVNMIVPECGTEASIGLGIATLCGLGIIGGPATYAACVETAYSSLYRPCGVLGGITKCITCFPRRIGDTVILQHPLSEIGLAYNLVSGTWSQLKKAWGAGAGALKGVSVVGEVAGAA